MQATPKNNLSPSDYECGADLQTLCRINGQLVQDNMTIIYDNSVVAGQTYNLAEIWNEIQDAMEAAYNLATIGVRGPDISGLTDKQKNEYTTLAYYNDLLSRLKKSTVSGSQYIKALDFVQNLQNGVKEYQLDSSLCNNCNSSCQYCDSCQSTCELTCQTGCEVSCETGCQVSCETGCQVSCQTSCESNCEGTCEISCQTGCETSCQTGCQASCQTTCQVVCESEGGGGGCDDTCCMVGSWGCAVTEQGYCGYVEWG